MEVPFSGQFLSDSNWPSIKALNSLSPITTTDEWDAGSIRFITHVDATGSDNESAPDDAVRRLVSIAIIQRLLQEELQDACDFLVDSFYWSLRDSLDDDQIHKPIKQMAPKIKAYKADPVTLDRE